MGSSLPSKEANLFKLVVKSYETKQYKKGLKAADQILKKFPEHGETLAMKGLTLNCMDRKDEAYELVRKGLKNDLKSHVCWHVYGLLYRSDREYREAIKCYRNALKIDPENIQILRDLSLLQAQMRDVGGFVETRRILLTLKPNNRNNWIGFAVAHHLNSNPGKAVDILEAYEGTLEEDYPQGSVDDDSSHNNEKYEHSEMLMYKVSLLEESGAFGKALDELDKKAAKIVDKLGVKEQYASLLIKLNRYEHAAECCRSLLKFNSDNYRYYERLEKCLRISLDERNSHTSEQVNQLLNLYDQLKKEFPKSAAVKRRPLDFLEKEAFWKAADDYVRPFLRKGVISLFSDLRPLYDHPGKADVLEEIFTQIEASLRASKSFPGSFEQEPPSTLLWTLLLLAQHYDYRRQVDKALLKIDEAILHTPTVVDLYLVKGRILKHAGNFTAAAALADEARSMDLADRYTNSECVKRMLQADQVELAEKIALLFTKDADHNLYDMQCMWYEVASGDSYFRRGALGLALKKFLAVEKHYADMVEDQFDFHTYCLRKMTLRAYVDMLRFQDHLHSHRFFHRAAAASIRCYLRLYDSPPKPSLEEDEAAIIGLPAVERKKIQKKQRKLENRAKREAEERAKEEESFNSVTSKGGKKACQVSRPVDSDPDGKKLIQVNDPLSEATRYLRLLQEHSPEVLETHTLAFEVHIRKHRFLLALQAVKRQLRLDPHHADVHRCFIRFFHIIDNLDPPNTSAKQLVQSVINTERASLECLTGKSLLETNKCFLDQHRDSLLHRAVAAEILYLLCPSQKSTALDIIESSVNKTSSGGTALGEGVGEWELKDCIFVHQLLESTFGDTDASTRWRRRCAELFPYSTYFEGSKSSRGNGNSECQNNVMASSEDIMNSSNDDNIGIENLKL